MRRKHCCCELKVCLNTMILSCFTRWLEKKFEAPVLYHFISYRFVSYPIISYIIISYQSAWYGIVTYRIVLYCIISFCVVLFHIFLNCVVLCRFVYYHIASYRIVLCRTFPYRSVSYTCSGYAFQNFKNSTSPECSMFSPLFAATWQKTFLLLLLFSTFILTEID